MQALSDYLYGFPVVQRVASRGEEIEYIFTQHQPRNEDERKLIENAQNITQRFSIAGVCLGFSMAVSLRRYAPKTFGDISPTRMMTDVMLTMLGFMIVSDYGIDSALENMIPLRRNLLLEDHPAYLSHMKKRFLDYPKAYKERNLFLDILRKEEFEEWKQHTKYRFENNSA
mmetsp:Transcript_12636/g.14545  ORF Transcript_12636/g.14545 Transcript_12636/m.14545 type:complete len:171 (+) Transcript_12636:31-543(+)